MKFQGVPYRVWRSSGRGPLKLVIQPTAIRVMKHAERMMKGGADITMTHDVVNQTAEKNMPYDTITVITQ